LTFEYPRQPFAIFLRMNADDVERTPAMQMFTIRGLELVKGSLKGLGGLDGKTSGDMFTPVHGSRLSYIGYAGVGVYNPYQALIVTGAPHYF
jgi:hypothetical protein